MADRDPSQICHLAVTMQHGQCPSDSVSILVDQGAHGMHKCCSPSLCRMISPLHDTLEIPADCLLQLGWPNQRLDFVLQSLES